MHRYTRTSPAKIAVWITATIMSLVLVLETRAAESGADPFESPEPSLDHSPELSFFKVETDIVTSVSRHPEALWGSAAAVYVISGRDIAASGADSLTEALRMAPGVDVADVDSNFTAVSARGSNGIFADKMLVLLDGRPIYTPTFGGTLWKQWNGFLPDIERIEVIRGPGGTLWGSNAVNGVINIITKAAGDTPGGHIRLAAGDNSTATAGLRLGGSDGTLDFRVFLKGASSKGYGGNSGAAIEDENDEHGLGYRFDWDLGRGLRFIGTGELYDNRLAITALENDGSAQVPPDKFETELYTTLWRLEKDFADGAQGHLQAATDYVDRRTPFLGSFNNIRRTVEVELDYGRRLGRRDRLFMSCGVNLRRSEFDFTNGVASMGLVGNDGSITLPRDTLNVLGAYLQYGYELDAATKITFGTKVENNSFTGTNLQPSVRAARRLDEDRTVWAAASRAVNTPSFGDMYVVILGTPTSSIINSEPTTVIPRFIAGGRADDTEMESYEIGYRDRINDSFSYDLTAFYHDYDNVASFSGASINQSFPQSGVMYYDTYIDNATAAYGYGGEVAADLTLNDRWRAEFNASFIHNRADGDTNPDTPQWKFNLRQWIEASPRLELVPSLHWVDRAVITAPLTGADTTIDSYLRLDLTANYRLDGGTTVSVIGKNLLERSHEEFFSELLRPVSPVTRGWMIRLARDF